MLEIAVDRGEPSVLAEGVDEVGAHRHQRARAAGGAIEAAEQFLPARLGSVVDLARRRFAPRRAPPGDCVLNPLPVGSEVVRERTEERVLVFVREGAVTRENLACERHA